MKIFFVATVGRQIEGELVIIRFERAFKQASKAEEFAKQLAKVYTETIKTEHGPVELYCERGVHEAELEDE